MTTAAEIIDGSLRLLGVLAEGETPSAAVMQDSIMAINQMIQSWDTERLSVFSTQDQVFTWPANVISRTLGPTGDFVGNRPIEVDDATYFKDPSSGLSFGVKLINQQQYDGIAFKTVTSTYPQVLWVNNTFPNIEMTIYPVPIKALEWHIVSVETLNEVSSVATDMYFPPGYLRAFRYNLACELAPEFGIEPSPQVQRIAMTSKRNLKRINFPGDLMAIPYPIVATRQRYNIYSNNF
jgi:hypothetical protein|tara:strand:- start:7540 stop:8250 length:711 start_codon:yes stop_codon:yes gene_type:complete